MVLRLQSVLTLYLSGVLAFLGLWWYTSWKKERLADKDDTNDETTTDQEHLSSYPRDLVNCVVANGHSTATHVDRHVVRERSLVEQELVDSTNTTAAAELGTVPLCQSQPEVRVVAVDCLSRGLDTAAVKPVTETAPVSQAQGGPDKDLALQRKLQPCSDEEQVNSICDLGSGKSNVCGESTGLNPQTPPLSETLEDTTNSTSNQKPEEVRLSPEEVRLSPEEVRLSPEEVRLSPEEVRLSPEEVRLSPEEVRLSPEEVRLSPEEVRLSPEEVRLSPEEVRLSPEEVRLSPEEVRLSPEEVRLSPEEVRLSPEEVRLSPEEVRLSPEEVRLSPEEVRLSPEEVRLSPEEVRLSPEEVRLSPEEVRLSPEEVRLSPEEVRLSPEEVRLSPEEVRLSPEEVRLSPEEVRLSPEEVRLSPEEVRLSPEEVRLSPEEVRLSPEEVRLSPEEVRLSPEEVRLSPEEVRLSPEEVRLSPEEVRLSPEEVRLSPEEVRLSPEEVRLSPEEVRLSPEEVRLSPEEVRLSVCFAMNSLSKYILPVVEEPTCESSLQASPRHLITSEVSASRQPLGIMRSPQKKDHSERCKLSRSNTIEITKLTSGMITDMVSAAVSQLLKENALLGHSVSPLRSRDPCEAPDHISMVNSGPESEMPPLLQEDQCSTTDRENISSSPIVQEDVKHDRSSRAEIKTEKTELAEEHSEVGDSGSSSGQTEEGSSGKDLITSVSLKPPRGPAEGLGDTTNGHRMEEVDVPGSGVNNVDSYCEHEARDNKHSNSPNLPSQLLNTDQPIEKYNQCHNSSQPPTAWEIEVPKHFVGRLIGKKGRYVNYLKKTSGAKVFITALPYTKEFQICHIEGSKEQVDCALEMIRKKFNDLDVTNCYVQPPVASLPSLSITSWLLLPHRVTVEVTVIQIVSGNCVFLQQHKHPTFHALCSLEQKMSLCYSHPGCPPLSAPVEVGVICAAQMPEGAWWRAQVMGYHEDTMEVELRYVDYGGYDIVKLDTLRQIRSNFVVLPFQGSEVILENIAPLPGEGFSAAAKSALEEMTQGLAVLAQVTNCHTSGIPLVQIWRTEGEELVSVNRALVDNGLCSWIDSS